MAKSFQTRKPLKKVSRKTPKKANPSRKNAQKAKIPSRKTPKKSKSSKKSRKTPTRRQPARAAKKGVKRGYRAPQQARKAPKQARRDEMKMYIPYIPKTKQKLDRDYGLAYQPFKTKQKASNIHPQLIAYNLLNQIRQLSGPVGYYVMVPTAKLNDMLGRQGPVILLLSDEHRYKKGCKICTVDKGCYSLFHEDKHTFARMLNEFMNKEKLVKDIFLERWGSGIKEKDLLQRKFEEKPQKRFHESALGDFSHVLKPCWNYQRENTLPQEMCMTKHIRVHKSDPRHLGGQDEYRYAESIFNVIRERYVNPSIFADYVNKYFPDFTAEEIFQLVLDRFEMGANKFLQTRFWTHPFFKKYSKMYKQIQALPENLQIIIKSYDQPEYHPVDQPRSGFRKQIANMMERNENPFGYLHDLMTDGDVNMYYLGRIMSMDLYFLGRALKSPIGGLPSQLTVLYGGGRHTNLLAYFLSRTGLYTCYGHQSWDADKCVKVSAHSKDHAIPHLIRPGE